MSRDEIRRLLGGYTTGNLTESERSALLAAALDDQELFDALARAQPLADLLADPGARARLLAALAEPQRRSWLRLWPALAASAALAAIVLAVLWVPRAGRHEAPKPVQVAEARKETPPSPAPPAAAPAPPPRPEPKPRPKARPKPAPEPFRDEQAPAMAQAEANSAQPAPRMRRSVLTRSALSLAETLPVTVLRLRPDGTYESVPGDADVRAGEAVRLRIQPAVAGFLRVAEREDQAQWRPVFNTTVEPGRAYLVPADGPVRLERAGTKEFVISVAAAEDQQPQSTRRLTLEVRPARSPEANP